MIGGITKEHPFPTTDVEMVTDCNGNLILDSLPPELPVATSRHVGGEDAGRFIICGGYADYTAQNDCLYWTPGQMNWVLGQKMQVARDVAAGDIVPGVGLLVTGGKDTSHNILQSTEIVSLDSNEVSSMLASHDSIFH